MRWTEISCVQASEVRHQSRMRSVEPQLQQQLIYYTQAWRCVFSEKRGVQRDKSVLTILLVIIEGPELVVNRKWISARVCG